MTDADGGKTPSSSIVQTSWRMPEKVSTHLEDAREDLLAYLEDARERVSLLEGCQRKLAAIPRGREGRQ